MHIPDGFLDSSTSVATAAVSIGAVGYSLRRLQNALADRTAPLMGVMAACVFAGQMVNFPVAIGTSGHLLGGVLTAALVGPWAACVVLSVVLIVQCLLFQDGGLLALGANVCNIGVVGAISGYCLYASIRRHLPSRWGTPVAGVVAAWFSILLSAAVCAAELAVSGTYPLSAVVSAMLLVHVLIGIGEALITGFALSFLVRTRPDLLYEPDRPGSGLVHASQVVIAGLGIALVIAGFLSPFASEFPDGLEWAAERIGIEPAAVPVVLPAPLPDYALPGIENLAVATSIAGLIGTLTVFAIAFAIGRSLWHVRVGNASHAA